MLMHHKSGCLEMYRRDARKWIVRCGRKIFNSGAKRLYISDAPSPLQEQDILKEREEYFTCHYIPQFPKGKDITISLGNQ